MRRSPPCRFFGSFALRGRHRETSLSEILPFDVEFQRELSQYSASPAPATGLPEGKAASNRDTHVPRSCPAGP